MIGQLLTIDEVADLLRTTPTAIYSQRHRSEAPGILGRKVGRRLLWAEADLDAWWNSTNGDGPTEAGPSSPKSTSETKGTGESPFRPSGST